MLGPWKVLTRGRLVASSAAWLCLSGCSGDQFLIDAGSSGTAGTKGGSDSAGESNGGSSNGASGGSGTAGDVASGGVIISAGSGGTGGTAPTVCDCPAGHYCRDGSTDCFDCAELNRLHFSAPERLSTLSDSGLGSRFPRVGTTGTDLLYRFEGAGMRYTTDASTSAGSNVMLTIPQDSGPLLLTADVTNVPGTMNLMSFNFLFDRIAEGTRRELFIGEWQNGLQAIERAPAPYNGGSSDFSVAVAHHATPDNIARAFWMTDRDVPNAAAGPKLVTALFVVNSPGAAVTLDIGKAACKPKDATANADADLTPWVTDDGKTLLLSTTRVDASCTPTDQGKDLYVALLQPATGQPTAAALPISDVNSAMNDVDPSFSADLCDLYFASDRDGKPAVYRAHRR